MPVTAATAVQVAVSSQSGLDILELCLKAEAFSATPWSVINKDQRNCSLLSLQVRKNTDMFLDSSWLVFSALLWLELWLELRCEFRRTLGSVLLGNRWDVLTGLRLQLKRLKFRDFRSFGFSACCRCGWSTSSPARSVN